MISNLVEHVLLLKEYENNYIVLNDLRGVYCDYYDWNKPS